MANIGMVSINTTDNAVRDIYDVYIEAGHTVTLLDQSSIINDPTLLLGFDVVACARLDVSFDSATPLVNAIQNGIPVIAGSYIGLISGGGTPVNERNNIVDVRLGFSVQSTRFSGPRFGVSIDISEVINNSLEFNYSGTASLRFVVGSTNFYGLEPTNGNGQGWLIDGQETLAVNSVNGVPVISFGCFYGRDTFTDVMRNILLALIDTALGDTTSLSRVNGSVTLDGQPYQSDVVVTSVEENPRVLGKTTSDVTGDYSLDIEGYSGAVMVNTVQEYGDAWESQAELIVGDVVHPSTPNGYVFRVTIAGTTGITEPTWPEIPDASVTDGGVTYSSEILLQPEIQGYIQTTEI